jgi:deoxyribodipyrimidine photo-lyase
MKKIDVRRTRSLNSAAVGKGPVIYWMSRDQRVSDNWALLYAQELARDNKQPLVVVFCLVPVFLEATIRQYGFMLKGLQEVERHLEKLNISFVVLAGKPDKTLPAFVQKHRAGAVITDFDPLRIKREWKTKVAKQIDCAMVEVDAHNIVPCWQASQKIEFGAYTLRPKIHKLLPEYLINFPKLRVCDASFSGAKKVDWQQLYRSLRVDMAVLEVDWLMSGEVAAQKWLKQFIKHKLSSYDQRRNDPVAFGQSGLSPYLHFGQISAQRVALEVKNAIGVSQKDKEAFLEELIVRRELADNFCLYNLKYDLYDGFPNWAKETLAAHAKDKREYVYTVRQFERTQTHDDLWNAAQLEMVQTGKMHGYMRMYWAKKILEWSASPRVAIKTALYLNDKYELDGRDPNGYAGVAWSIGGVHDRAWFERPVFGKIRYMNYNGCKSKFDVKKYIASFVKK